MHPLKLYGNWEKTKFINRVNRFTLLREEEGKSILKIRGYEPSMIFIIPYRNARCFMPNFHTDFIFSKNLLAEKQVHFHAFKVDLIDPVTVDLSSTKKNDRLRSCR